jgi:hypothetical protein
VLFVLPIDSARSMVSITTLSHLRQLHDLGKTSDIAARTVLAIQTLFLVVLSALVSPPSWGISHFPMFWLLGLATTHETKEVIETLCEILCVVLKAHVLARPWVRSARDCSNPFLKWRWVFLIHRPLLRLLLSLLAIRKHKPGYSYKRYRVTVRS